MPRSSNSTLSHGVSINKLGKTGRIGDVAYSSPDVRKKYGRLSVIEGGKTTRQIEFAPRSVAAEFGMTDEEWRSASEQVRNNVAEAMQSDSPANIAKARSLERIRKSGSAISE